MKLALNDSLRVELKILTYLYERQRLPITIKGCLKIDPCQDYFIFKGGGSTGLEHIPKKLPFYLTTSLISVWGMNSS